MFKNVINSLTFLAHKVLTSVLWEDCFHKCILMLDWKEHKLESRFPGEISITSDVQMTPPLWQKVKRNSKAS